MSTDALRGYFDTPDARRHPEKAAGSALGSRSWTPREAKGQCGEKAEAEQAVPAVANVGLGKPAPRAVDQGLRDRLPALPCRERGAVPPDRGFGPTSRSR